MQQALCPDTYLQQNPSSSMQRHCVKPLHPKHEGKEQLAQVNAQHRKGTLKKKIIVLNHAQVCFPR